MQKTPPASLPVEGSTDSPATPISGSPLSSAVIVIIAVVCVLVLIILLVFIAIVIVFILRSKATNKRFSLTSTHRKGTGNPHG